MGREEIGAWLSNFPEVIAILVVAFGWLLARLLRRAVGTGLPMFNKLTTSWGTPDGALLTSGFTRAMQSIVYWGTLLISVMFGLFLLSGGEPGQWIDGLLFFMSQILVALAIIVSGHVLGLLARRLLGALPGTARMTQLPITAYVLIVLIAVLTALKNLGLDVSFVTQVLLIFFSVFLASVALAFALGARSLVANLTAQGELKRYKPGDRLIVDSISGTVLEIHRTGIVLSTQQGVACVPASKFAESTVIETRTGDDDE